MTSRPMRRAPSLALAALVALAGCRKAKEEPLAPPPPAIQVTAAPAQARPMPRSLPLTGALIANQQADVAANASGRVTKTFVERGALVRAGAPLAQLDVRGVSLSEEEANANLETARAQQGLADAQCKRYQSLYDKGAISRDEWDRFTAGCRTSSSAARAARARVGLARKNLSDATVRAPFAGMIAERYVSAGEYVQPQSKVATVVELTPIRLQITVSEADVSQVKEGQAVAFEVEAFPGETFTAKVAFVGPSVRTATRDLVVEAIAPNVDRKLRPGMFASVKLQLADELRPAVPRSALRTDGSTSRLFAVVNGHLEERVVQVGPERDGLVAVLEGLKPGEQVVTQLTDAVRDGVPVR